ncbi:ABC transporter substrate-binding protein [Tenacibaculum aiptasiae]|uniref:ABC transporter substrate-binding protein n=1 Tax=Tenacibaculum aiptasiae TaxID=426481 RepID=UPI003B5B7061
MKYNTLLIVISFLFLQCKKSENKEISKSETISSPIKYAKGFDIITQDGQKKLVFKRVFQNSKKQFVYTLSNSTNISKNEIKTPIERLVVTSTTHVPMLELLSSEEKLIGFPHTKYISSEKTRKRIEEGKIVELGSEQNMNTEKLMDLHPELVIAFSLHPNNKLYENIKKTGIPVIFNGDWLEETPLGRAEWIKFFGALLNKEKEADSIFKTIEQNYLKAKEIAKNNKGKQPTVLSGSMFKNVWNVPAGESFMATYLKDANLNYLWKNTKGTGSLQLSFESILDKGKHADYWIGCGLFETKEQLVSANNHYKEFDALNNGNVYTIGSKRGKTGGFLYFELAPVRPDLVLKDFIKITNPKLLPDYNLTFFDQLK